MFSSRDFIYIRSHRGSVYIRRNRTPKIASLPVDSEGCQGKNTDSSPVAVQDNFQAGNGIDLEKQTLYR